jgi:hypothetical protein
LRCEAHPALDPHGTGVQPDSFGDDEQDKAQPRREIDPVILCARHAAFPGFWGNSAAITAPKGDQLAL